MNKHPLANCEECPLVDDGFCPSSGPEKADIVIIGEAPGFNEVKKGEPFIGQSGQLLGMVLRNYGIEREDVFFTNTVLCRPEGNANPPAAAIKACGDRLDSEVKSRSPKTIMALGNFATKRISRKQGLVHRRLQDVSLELELYQPFIRRHPFIIRVSFQTSLPTLRRSREE